MRLLLRQYLSRNIRALLPFYRSQLDHMNSILDIGSGNGLHARVLSQEYPKMEITTLDVDDYRWEKSSGQKHISYDGYGMPISSRRYDASLLFFVLHHAEDQNKLIQEAARVTRKRIIVCEEVYETAFQKLCMVMYDTLINRIIFGERISEPHFRTEAAWVSLFGSVGIKIIDIYRMEKNPFYPPSRIFFFLQP